MSYLNTMNKSKTSGNQKLSDKVISVLHEQSSVLLTENNRTCSLFSTTKVIMSTDNTFKLHGIQTSSKVALYTFLVFITYKTHLMHED